MSSLPSPADFKNHQMQFAAVQRFGDEDESLPPEQIEKEFDSFAEISFKHHAEELEAIAPKWLFKQADAADLGLFRAMVRYDERNRTAVTGCYRNDPLAMEIISYKRRRFMGGKWITRKATHPNGTPFIRIFTDDKPVVIVEGHHDALTAVLLGLDFVMLPTASFRGSIDAAEIEGRELVFIIEDEPAYKTMRRIAEELEPHAGSVTLKQFRCGLKMDLSDFTETCQSIEGVRSCL